MRSPTLWVEGKRDILNGVYLTLCSLFTKSRKFLRLGEYCNSRCLRDILMDSACCTIIISAWASCCLF